MNKNYLEKYSIFGRILQKSGKNTGETDAGTKLVTNADAAAAGTAAVANAAAYASAADTNLVSASVSPVFFPDFWSILPNMKYFSK